MPTIFIWFTLEAELTLTYIVWFVESFSIRDFNGLEKLLYLFLEYCSRLGIVAKRKYLEAFLKTDGKSSIFEHNIKLDNMTQYNYSDASGLEEAYRVISSAIFTYYDKVIAQDMTDRLFNVDMDTWMNNQKKALLQKTMTDNFPRIIEGDKADDIMSDIQLDLDRVQLTYDKKKLDSLEFLHGSTGEYSGAGKSKLLCKTGVPVIDGSSGDSGGGIYEGDIITMTGLTGSGKTRFAMRVAYNAAVMSAISVRIDSLELTRSQIENMLVAMHIVTLFRGEVKIPDSAMTRGELSPEQMKYYYAAKEDLFNNPKYGKFFIFDDKLEVDLFYKKAKTWLRLNKDVKVWFIDYAGNVKVSPLYGRYMDKAGMIETLYETVSDINKLTGSAFFILNQYNREGAEKARAGKKIDQGDIQGGQTVHKWTTFNIYTTQTPEQLAANRMNMSCDKARFVKYFSQIPFEIDLAISRFTQLKKEVVN